MGEISRPTLSKLALLAAQIRCYPSYDRWLHTAAKLFQGEFHMSPSSLPLLLAVCCLVSASSLPLASTTSQTTATKGAKLPRAPLFRLGRKSAAAATTYKQAAAVATKKPVATLVGDEKKAKAPHCRDTKAGCTHAAKKAAKQAANAKLAPAAQQAEPKQKTAADFLTFGGLSAAIVAKHEEDEEDEEATAIPSASSVHRHPTRAKLAAARASAAAAKWSRFDQGEGTAHEDRSGHAGATVRTMEPTGGKPRGFSLFQPGAFYP